MKRFLAFLLLLTILIATCIAPIPIKVQAASSSILVYELNSDGQSYSVVDCPEDALGDITIPSTYRGKPVTGIGNSAFYCPNLTSVTIPKSITSIGRYAFNSTRSLTGIWVDPDNPNYSNDSNGVLFNKDKTVLIVAPHSFVGPYNIPASVTRIEDAAFVNCKTMTSVTVPGNVTDIGNDAFSNCSLLDGIWVDPDNPNYSSDSSGALLNKDKNLLICVPGGIESYDIPAGVTRIDDRALYYCINLTTLTIPDTVTHIGDYAFSGCNALTSLTIPSSVIDISSSAITRCNSLSGFWVDPDNPNYSSDSFGALFNKDKTVLLEVPRTLKTYAIPEGVTSIDHAFSYCTALTEVTFPNSLTNIGSGAFHYCDNLVSITIPDHITSIGDSAFYYCSKLTEVTIPISITSIGDSAFEVCNALKDIYYPGTRAQWDAISIGKNVRFKNLKPHFILCETNGHIEQIVPGKAATYTETGLTEGKMCATCGAILLKQYTLPVIVPPTTSPAETTPATKPTTPVETSPATKPTNPPEIAKDNSGTVQDNYALDNLGIWIGAAVVVLAAGIGIYIFSKKELGNASAPQ